MLRNAGRSNSSSVAPRNNAAGMNGQGRGSAARAMAVSGGNEAVTGGGGTPLSELSDA